MELIDSDVPLPGSRPRIGIIYNLKSGALGGDAEAEYDSIDTVYAIRDVFEKNGLSTALLQADRTLPRRLEEARIDIAFNIAEGLRGRGREAMAPALLNLYGIPFTGSDETALAVALDKALTKKLLLSEGVRTPGFAVAAKDRPFTGGLRFPLIVKPNCEGSSKGILEKCVVKDEAELQRLLAENFRVYNEEMLIEEYIEGREFTVGILGNGGDACAFEPMEIVFRHPTQESFHIYSFGVKQDYKKHIEYRCPSDISRETAEEMKAVSLRVFRALGCRDFGRVDFRLSEEGELQFIEINPLPGLAPGYSDYPMLAEFCGVGYERLVLAVLEAGAARCGLRLER